MLVTALNPPMAGLNPLTFPAAYGLFQDLTMVLRATTSPLLRWDVTVCMGDTPAIPPPKLGPLLLYFI